MLGLEEVDAVEDEQFRHGCKINMWSIMQGIKILCGAPTIGHDHFGDKKFNKLCSSENA